MSNTEIQLSKEFKIQTTKAIFTVSAFVLSYLIILLLAFGLTALCIIGGFSLIAAKPMFFTIAFGIGLASVGILIVIFLIKFIFKSHKTDLSHLVEINQLQQPELFETIDELVAEVGTLKPKKVYISADVNASVFYDSSFWSMFLPVKKNLVIGLGLVNTVTKEELKAILAHEFGHFSQKTMKVGSYVYNVNQVIFNMLYENESYDNLIQKWADVSGYFSIFLAIAVKINQGIQWILRKLYDIVNKSYMGLSREMEFHADEIAASVTGFQPLKKSLLRMSLADNSYNNVIGFYSGKIAENIISENIYRDQSSVVHFVSETNNLTLTHNLPDINLEEQSKYDKSKLNITNQWASHPSIADRIARLEKTGFNHASKSDKPANELFIDINKLQKQLTKKIFETVKYEGIGQQISSEGFIEEYKKAIAENSFHKIYNGYYDNKNPLHFDLNNEKEVKMDWIDLFSDEKVDWVYTSIALQNDIDTLQNISSRRIPIKSFDYDGLRYKRKDAKTLSENLKKELEAINKKITENDIAVYTFFLKLENEQNKPAQLKQLYNEFFSFDKQFEAKYEHYATVSNGLQFVSVVTPLDQIIRNLKGIKPTEEKIKQEIDLLLIDDFLKAEITAEIRDNWEKYRATSLEYFGEVSYNDDNLNILYKALHDYAYILSRKYFLIKKKLLAYQVDLIDNKTL